MRFLSTQLYGDAELFPIHAHFACFPINDTIFPYFQFKWLWSCYKNFPEGCWFRFIFRSVRNRNSEHLHILNDFVFLLLKRHITNTMKWESDNDTVPFLSLLQNVYVLYMASHDSLPIVICVSVCECMGCLPTFVVVVPLKLYWFSSGALVAFCKQWKTQEAKTQ